MFSSAVSIGSRLKNWKTKPMRSRRSFVSCVSLSSPSRRPGDPDLTLGRLVEPGEDVHQRRLAGAGRPHHRGQPAAHDLDGDVAQRVDSRLPDAVAAADSRAGDDRSRPCRCLPLALDGHCVHFRSFCSCIGSVAPQQGAVEERDHAPLVLRRLRLDAGDVLAVRDLPDLLRVAGRRVEVLVRLPLAAALALLAVDEEDGSRSDLLDLALQARRGQVVREEGGREGDAGVGTISPDSPGSPRRRGRTGRWRPPRRSP